MENERINTIGQFFKINYHHKYVKLAIDGGFTCPNRDGKISSKGCIFCSERGSGDFTGNIDTNENQSIENQILAQKKMIDGKWKDAKYIAYFQNFSNTYDSVSNLKEKFDTAIHCEGIEGLAIATRADCLSDEIIELLKTYNVFWVELGLQSSHIETRKWYQGGIEIKAFEAGYKKLHKEQIPTVLHIIAGAPQESKEDFLQTVKYVNQLNPFGVKFHMLNVLKNTPLADIYAENPFELISKEVYVDWVCDALEILDPQITVHRLTGDGPKALLIEPKWILNKRAVLNGIQKELLKRKGYQGIYFEK